MKSEPEKNRAAKVRKTLDGLIERHTGGVLNRLDDMEIGFARVLERFAERQGGVQDTADNILGRLKRASADLKNMEAGIRGDRQDKLSQEEYGRYVHNLQGIAEGCHGLRSLGETANNQALAKTGMLGAAMVQGVLAYQGFSALTAASSFAAVAGPIGMAVAAVAMIGSCLMRRKSGKGVGKALAQMSQQICNLHADMQMGMQAIVANQEHMFREMTEQFWVVNQGIAEVLTTVKNVEHGIDDILLILVRQGKRAEELIFRGLKNDVEAFVAGEKKEGVFLLLQNVSDRLGDCCSYYRSFNPHSELIPWYFLNSFVVFHPEHKNNFFVPHCDLNKVANFLVLSQTLKLLGDILRYLIGPSQRITAEVGKKIRDIYRELFDILENTKNFLLYLGSPIFLENFLTLLRNFPEEERRRQLYSLSIFLQTSDLEPVEFNEKIESRSVIPSDCSIGNAQVAEIHRLLENTQKVTTGMMDMFFARYQMLLLGIDRKTTEQNSALDVSSVQTAPVSQDVSAFPSFAQFPISDIGVELKGAQELAEKLDGKHAIVFFGASGVGKSALANFLGGCVLNKKVNEETGASYVALAADSPPMQTKMSDSGTSCTSEPVIVIYDRMAYCDFPGLLDNRGDRVQIHNMLQAQLFLRLAQGVRIVLVVECEMFFAVRGKAFIELLPLFAKILLKVSGASKDHVRLVVTKGEERTPAQIHHRIQQLYADLLARFPRDAVFSDEEKLTRNLLDVFANDDFASNVIVPNIFESKKRIELQNFIVAALPVPGEQLNLLEQGDAMARFTETLVNAVKHSLQDFASLSKLKMELDEAEKRFEAARAALAHTNEELSSCQKNRKIATGMLKKAEINERLNADFTRSNHAEAEQEKQLGAARERRASHLDEKVLILTQPVAFNLRSEFPGCIETALPKGLYSRVFRMLRGGYRGRKGPKIDRWRNLIESGANQQGLIFDSSSIELFRPVVREKSFDCLSLLDHPVEVKEKETVNCSFSRIDGRTLWFTTKAERRFGASATVEIWAQRKFAYPENEKLAREDATLCQYQEGIQRAKNNIRLIKQGRDEIAEARRELGDAATAQTDIAGLERHERRCVEEHVITLGKKQRNVLSCEQLYQRILVIEERLEAFENSLRAREQWYRFLAFLIEKLGINLDLSQRLKDALEFSGDGKEEAFSPLRMASG